MLKAGPSSAWLKETDGAWSPLAGVAPEVVGVGKTGLAERLQPSSGLLPESNLGDQLMCNGDAMFDRVSEALLDTGSRSRLVDAVVERIEDLIEERAALEMVNAGLRERLMHERQTMADYVRNLGNRMAARPRTVTSRLARAQRQAAVYHGSAPSRTRKERSTGLRAGI